MASLRKVAWEAFFVLFSRLLASGKYPGTLFRDDIAVIGARAPEQSSGVRRVTAERPLLRSRLGGNAARNIIR